MKAARVRNSKDRWVRLQLSKGVRLVLTLDEYVMALQRGKLERRAERRTSHAITIRARSDAGSLAWIMQEKLHEPRHPRAAFGAHDDGHGDRTETKTGTADSEANSRAR